MFPEFPTKLLVILAIVTALIGGATAGYNAIEQSGYDRAQSELLVAHKKELRAINDAFVDELEKAKHEAKYYKQVAILMQDVKPVVLTKYKDKIINANHNCSTITGFSELLNQSIKRFDI